MDSDMETSIPSTSNSIKEEDTTSTSIPITTTVQEGGGYTDYILRSSDPSQEWRYNIMKFGALGDRQVNPASDNFIKPVKLNRKDPRTVRRLNDEERDKMNLKAAEGGNIKDVTEVKKEGEGPNDYKPTWKKDKEAIDLTLVGVGTSGNQPKVRNKANMFKKKIKRIFVSSEEARRLKREEWMPWVLEDDEGNERWIGRLEGGTGESSSNTLAASASALKKSEEADKNGTGMTGWRPSASASEAGGGGSSYVAFVFGKGGDDFKVVPASRWYKFSRGPRHATLGTEEAEEEYNRLQKSQEPERWMMHRRTAPLASTSTDSTTPTLPTGKGKLKISSKTAPAPPSNIRSRILDKSVLSLPKLDAGKPKFRSVIKGSSGGNGDDELRGRKSRGDGGRGQEQEDDEFDYEEDFQDDEEGIAKIDDLADEQETREVEDRIKKEMRGANRFDMEVDDEDDDEDDLTNTGKELKKLVKKGDKEGAYESDNDDFDNPYASSEYDDDDAASMTSVDPTSEKSRPSSNHMNRSSSHKSSSNSQHRRTSSSSNNNNNNHSNRNSNSNSRAGSRSGSPALAGSTSASIAKRAASPGASSNGGGGNGRASKPASRGSSPSGTSAGGGGKRKRVEELGDESDGTKRKRNTDTPPPPGDDLNLMKESDLIAYLKSKGDDKPTTKEVLSHFKKEFKADSRNKSNISGLLRAVADLVGGKLELKAGL